MPNQSQSGWHGTPWHRCDRCGCDFRVTDLTRQNGFLLCADCLDNPIAWQRDRIIADVLGDGEPEARVADELTDLDEDPEINEI